MKLRPQYIPPNVFELLGIEVTADYRPELADVIIPVVVLAEAEDPEVALPLPDYAPGFMRYATRAAGGAGTFASIQLVNDSVDSEITIRHWWVWKPTVGLVQAYDHNFSLATDLGVGKPRRTLDPNSNSNVFSGVPAAVAGTEWFQFQIGAANTPVEVLPARGIVVPSLRAFALYNATANEAISSLIEWDE